MRSRKYFASVVCLLLLIAGGSSFASSIPGDVHAARPGVINARVEVNPSGPAKIDAYGTTSNTAVFIPAASFHPRFPSVSGREVSSGKPYIYQTANGANNYLGFWDGARLPSGASLYCVDFLIYDNNADADASLLLGQENIDESGVPGAYNALLLQFSSGTPGYTRLRIFLPTAYTVPDNYTSQLVVLMGTEPSVTDESIQFGGVVLWYSQQISPGPAVATFADVPTDSGIFKFVEALYASGITAGCGGGNYCPNSSLTRGQMAVFFATALGLHWPN